MSREAKKATDPDVGLHALNFAWSLGFQRALGADPDASDEQRLELRSRGATAAMRDQYYAGIRDGRRMREAWKAAATRAKLQHEPTDTNKGDEDEERQTSQ